MRKSGSVVSVTTWYRVLLENVIVAQLVKKFSAFYGPVRLIIASKFGCLANKRTAFLCTKQ
jgi:hypothetical protein